MPNKAATKNKSYTARLYKLEYKQWKTWLQVQLPYRWNLQRLNPGKTVDIGCGIGRHLKHLPAGSVGTDHNKHSVEQACRTGLLAYTPDGFQRSRYYKEGAFDSLLLSHVLEHLTIEDGLSLIRDYTPLLKRNGKLIIFCPQERGYASDSTHVTFQDAATLKKMAGQAGYKVTVSTSFPFPRPAGKFFKYNEFVVVARKT